MCIDFKQVDLAHIRKRIGDLTTPSSPPKDDPILGPPSFMEHMRHSFKIKHGYLIQDTVLHLTMAAPGWSGFKEFGVQTVNGHGLPVTSDFMDNVLYNKHLDWAIGLECKRVLSNRDRASENEIRRHADVFRNHRQQVIRDCGLSPNALTAFVVMDAYGEPGQFVPGLPTIHSSQLDRIFGDCLKRAVYGFTVETIELVSERVIREEPNFTGAVGLESSVQDLQDTPSLTELSERQGDLDQDVCLQPTRDEIDTFLRSMTKKASRRQ